MYYLIQSDTGMILETLSALPADDKLQALADTFACAFYVIEGQQTNIEYEPISHPILAGAPLLETSERWGIYEADAAAARADVPELVAEVERLRAIVDAAPEYAAYVYMALATFDTPMSLEEWYADGEAYMAQDGAE